MLTDEDTTKIVDKLIEVNKKLFYTRPEMDDLLDDKVEGLRTDFSNLQTSVESFATSVKKNSDEIKAVNKRVNDHEDWINKVVPKVEVEFKP